MTENEGFLRVLGRWDVLALAFGAMIGFGWVVKTSDFINNAGPLGATLAFAVGGVIVALVGLTYSELVSAMPKAGGEHNYVLRALGSRPAFIASWALVLGYITVVAFEAVALPETLVYLFPGLEVGQLWQVGETDVFLGVAVVGVIAAIVLTAVNYIGIRPASVFQSIAVLFLLAAGAAMIIGSLTGGTAKNMEPLITGGLSGFTLVLVAVPFFFVGFDVIPQSAGEIKVPFRKVGTLLVISVVMAALWYIMIILTAGSGLPADKLADSDLASADAMAALWNSQAMGNVLTIGGVAGILTSWNGFLIGSSRLLYAMAHSKMIPAWFGKLHPRHRTPSNAVLFVGTLSVIAPFFGNDMLTWLVNAGGINIVVAYFLVALSFLVLRSREPDMERPFRTPAGPFVGWAAMILSAGLFVLYLPGMPAALKWPWEWVIVGIWWIAGIVFLLRLPSVGPGADAEDRLIAAATR